MFTTSSRRSQGDCIELLEICNPSVQENLHDRFRVQEIEAPASTDYNQIHEIQPPMLASLLDSSYPDESTQVDVPPSFESLKSQMSLNECNAALSHETAHFRKNSIETDRMSVFTVSDYMNLGQDEDVPAIPVLNLEKLVKHQEDLKNTEEEPRSSTATVVSTESQTEILILRNSAKPDKKVESEQSQITHIFDSFDRKSKKKVGKAVDGFSTLRLNDDDTFDISMEELNQVVPLPAFERLSVPVLHKKKSISEKFGEFSSTIQRKLKTSSDGSLHRLVHVAPKVETVSVENCMDRGWLFFKEDDGMIWYRRY